MIDKKPRCFSSTGSEWLVADLVDWFKRCARLTKNGGDKFYYILDNETKTVLAMVGHGPHAEENARLICDTLLLARSGGWKRS